MQSTGAQCPPAARLQGTRWALRHSGQPGPAWAPVPLLRRWRRAAAAALASPAICRASSSLATAAAAAEEQGRLARPGDGGPAPGWRQHITLRPLQPQPASLDAQGLVPCCASLAAVPQPLLPLLEAAVTAYQEQLGPRLLGVYVRGSLVQGGFLPGLSDADFLALYRSAGEASSGAGEEAAVQAGLQSAAAHLQGAFPQCAKVELKAVPLPADSAMALLAQLDPGGGSGTQQPMSPVPPSAILDHRPLAFQLKSQAVRLWGWDLPRLLPDVAALPPLHLLPSLVVDVERALQHAQQAALASNASSSDTFGGSAPSSDAAARAVRWALKRCIRAAFELTLCGGGGGSRGDTSASTSSASCSAGGSEQGRVYSRDLFWCWRCASQRQPELSPHLEAALRLYLALGPEAGGSADDAGAAAGGGAGPAGAGGLSQEEQRTLLEQGWSLAGQLSADIDRLFLQEMLQEEPEWLTHHGGAAQQPFAIPRPSTAAHGAGGSSSSSSDRSDGQSSSRSGGSLGWQQQLRLRLWAAAAAGRGAELESDLVGCPPPAVGLAIAGSVLTLDWARPVAREQAATLIAAAFLPRGTGDGSSGASGSSEASYGTAAVTPRAAPPAPLPQQPVLLKGAAAHWPAVKRWSLGRLAAAGLAGRVRVAPSLQFPFTEPRLGAILAAQQGAAALPSCVATMGEWEFAARLQRGNPCRLPPLVYGGSTSETEGAETAGAAGQPEGPALENYYLQAELSGQLLEDIDLSRPPFALPALGPALRQTQAARVWVSPQGAVSPTHYDLSHSFLTQVKGRKRMLFWSPDDLLHLYFYPDTHLLRRRSRVNVHAPDFVRFPLAKRAQAWEAMLEPGDVVFFPSRWAHYTESLDFSISVTSRFGAA